MAQKLPTLSLRMADLLAPPYRFAIPPYQRAYSWSVRDAAQLVDDVVAAAAGPQAAAAAPQRRDRWRLIPDQCGGLYGGTYPSASTVGLERVATRVYEFEGSRAMFRKHRQSGTPVAGHQRTGAQPGFRGQEADPVAGRRACDDHSRGVDDGNLGCGNDQVARAAADGDRPWRATAGPCRIAGRPSASRINDPRHT